ncbi:transcription-repair coupling factor (superfamily II helicase) [Sphingomonas zeicaulis]|uniref:helicase-related protein n=1 Tax=Sphingomonas zeicaulis TaxID=1632740 RepID=UPI003D22BE08
MRTSHPVIEVRLTESSRARLAAAPNIALVAIRIVEARADSNVLYLADDEQQAESLAFAASAIAGDAAIIFLPSSDALPGDEALASPANSGRRVAALRRLRRVVATDAHYACIMSGEAAARLYPAPEAFDAAPPMLATDDPIDAEALRASLLDIGYVEDDRVDEPGEIAFHGDVIDIFPADAGLPVRIEIVEDRIAAIRFFDPLTQRTTDACERIEVGRATEPPVAATGTSILAHLQPGLIGYGAQAEHQRLRFQALARDTLKRRTGTSDLVDDKAWQAALSAWRIHHFTDGGATALPRFVERRRPLDELARFAKPLLAEGRRLIIVGGERDLRFVKPRLRRRLRVAIEDVAALAEVAALPGDRAAALIMPADRGFVDDTRLVLAAGDLLGSRAILDRPLRGGIDPLAAAAGDIRAGDTVIHEDHGVAVVTGLADAVPAEQDTETIVLEFAGDARRLVPITEAGRIWRYGADRDAVTLDRLDGASWPQRRDTIMAAIASTATKLTELAAARRAIAAPVMEPDEAQYERVVGSFAFNETADQARAIAAVRDDLASGQPMDRLIVGDVGYGKTEVALRAAAIAAFSGYQVAVAAPTTVLVRQHIETFRQRFEASGIGVDGLSRLSSAADRKRVKAGLADGSVRIVIGTGAIMGKAISYAKLGLVIIDEEQRFGAADKERLRGDGARHLLTMSATPIPRTLQMAMVGVRDISVIATAPARRQPIRTRLEPFDPHRVRTALLREKQRGGQSFVVVPRIDDMANVRTKLERAVPELGIVEAHGKMAAADIDRVMVDFARGTGDILLATNIIEAGLDVPRANTMLVWRADRFGLAQLHQLRGRVGRGVRRGQVMLVTDAEAKIADRTLKRLRTLATFDQLGAGFQISQQDLDQRGAGDLMGEAQAGHTKLIGVDLYQHLFAAALREARGEPPLPDEPELRIGAAGMLPPTWIPEPDVRLGLYVRLARVAHEAELDAFEDEIVDRFGTLPMPAEILLMRARLRLAARSAHVVRLDAGPAAVAITPGRGFTADIATYGFNQKNGRLIRQLGPEDRDLVLVRTLELLEACNAE